jgi:translocation and assembly module TamB
VQSADLQLFRTTADVRVARASVTLPRSRVELAGIDGEIPINLDLTVDRRGVKLLRGTSANPYSVLRFADQHPLLQRSSFLSIASIKTPMISIAPLAGNLQIEQNVVSLSQLELGVRGGRVTGQCILDWAGKKSMLRLHARASGLKSSHGERFDGNAAVVISAADRSIDGRADILSIGRRHLLDLLDVSDPLHTDASINRIRRALAFGYPDRVRLGFDQGFASMKITVGGAARLIRIDELKGIPIGPLLDKAFVPLSR